MTRDWVVWQLVDTAFPSGSFAHSGGLEAAWQLGYVRGDTLAPWVEAQLHQAGRGILPFVMAAWKSPEALAAATRACDLFLNQRVANRASRAQGRALLSAASRIFHVRSLQSLERATRLEQSAAHLGPIFGVLCAELGIEQAQTARMFLFVVLRGLLSSAVRLGMLGPLEAQSLQLRLVVVAERVAQRSLDRSMDDAAQTSPVADLLQGTRDRLYSRLFQS